MSHVEGDETPWKDIFLTRVYQCVHVYWRLLSLVPAAADVYYWVLVHSASQSNHCRGHSQLCALAMLCPFIRLSHHWYFTYLCGIAEKHGRILCVACVLETIKSAA